MANIVVIKTIPGEELIAELVEDKGLEGIVVSRPRQFQIIPDQTGKGTPSISPWIATDPDNKSVWIRYHYIASFVTAPFSIEKAYLETVSGFDLSGKLK